MRFGSAAKSVVSLSGLDDFLTFHVYDRRELAIGREEAKASVLLWKKQRTLRFRAFWEVETESISERVLISPPDGFKHLHDHLWVAREDQAFRRLEEG